MDRNKILGVVIAVALMIGLGAWLVSRTSETLDSGESDSATHGDTGGRGPAQRRASDRPDLALAPKAAISGTIRDPKGNPIAGAQVCVWLDANELEGRVGGTPRCTKSESDGHYRLAELMPIRVGVYAEARGFIPQRWFAQHETHRETQLQLVAGSTREQVDFVLRPGGVALHGVVRDISGGVIEGAFVWSHGAYFQATGRTAAVSDSEGRFTLWSEPGRVDVFAEADGYASNERLVMAPGSTAEIYLAPESVISGRVVMAASGEPVSGVVIEAMSEARRGSPQSARSDDAGKFRINKLQPGIYTVGGRGDELYGEASELVHLGLAETTEGLLIELHPAFMVSGRVTLAGTKARACAEGSVQLQDRSDKRNTIRARVNANGAVELRSVLPGNYEVVVRCEGMVPAPEYPDIVVTDSNLVDEVWEVREGLSIRGIVVDAEGSAIEGISVSASMKADPTDPRKQVTGGRSDPSLADGSFTCSGLLAGTYEVRVVASDRSLASEAIEVVLEPSADINDIRVELRSAGTITGLVRDADGRSVGDVVLRVRPTQGFSSAVAVSGDDGRFVLKPLPPGEVRVFALDSGGGIISAPGSSDEDQQGTLVTVEGGQTTEVEIVLESREAVIRGRVLDEQGSPVTDAFVNHQRMSDSAKGQGSLHWSVDQPVLTDLDGRFVIEGLAPDASYVIGAFRKGGGKALEEGIHAGEAVELTIVETGEIAGKVVLGNGDATPERFKLTARGSGAAQAVTRTDELFRSGGQFHMKELPPGTYALIVESPAGDARLDGIELGGGEIKENLRIKLAPRVTVRGRVIDLDTRSPIAGMTVTIAARGTTLSFGPHKSSDRPRTSDADGRFEVPNVATGNVRVWLQPRNLDSPYDWQWLYAQIPESNEIVDIGNLAIIADRTKRGEKPGDLGFEIQATKPDAKPEDFLAQVALIRPGGPAEAAGLAVGAVIQTVNGHDVQGSNSSRFPRLTQVPPGTTVKLGLADDRTITITASPSPI